MEELELNYDIQFLDDVQNLLNTPGVFIKDFFAADAYGYAVDPLAPGACKFCALGACERIAGDRVNDTHSRAMDALYKACKNQIGIESLTRLNDDAGLDGVNQAIEIAKGMLRNGL